MAPDSTRSVIDGRELRVSNLGKVLFPRSGFTKGQVIDYYMRIADVMLPHVRDRPVTMRRYPNGVDHPSFFEKHVPTHAPPWVRRISVPTSSDAGPVEYAVVSDRATLAWAANLAALEYHVPLWHIGRRKVLPASPDHLVFDLDPGEGATIVECCRVARHLVELLAGGRAHCWPKTSGSKGLQLYQPVHSRTTWDSARERARGIAVRLEREHPDLVVSNMSRRLRAGKVLIDWSQNHPAKTTVAAYSIRGRDEPTVSTPISWDEVDQGAASDGGRVLRFTTDDVLTRVETDGDLFAGLALGHP